MAIEVSCESCSGHFRVPDTAAGKKIRCPKCRGAIDVPVAETPASAATDVFVPLPPAAKQELVFSPPVVASAPPPTSKVDPPADQWHLKTAEGEEYGPVSRSELDEWFAEGRVTLECHIRSSTDEQWRSAASLFPQLNAARAAAPPLITKAKRSSTALAAVDRSQRSRMVAGFLGVFLGPLGIHRFYLGYWGVGLAMLFTGGGLGVWSLIDAVLVALGRVHDADGRPLSD